MPDLSCPFYSYVCGTLFDGELLIMQIAQPYQMQQQHALVFNVINLLVA